MQLFIVTMAGGAIGAGARFLVNIGCLHYLGAGFPWATLLVNIVGSFLMGAVVAASESLLSSSAPLRTFLATGILGGFTTFSAFSLDVVQLAERHQATLAGLYITASVALSIGALLVGMAAARAGFR